MDRALVEDIFSGSDEYYDEPVNLLSTFDFDEGEELFCEYYD